MHTTALTQAITLYRSGTLTFTQAASRAGRSEEAFEQALGRFGVERRPETPSVGGVAKRPAGAD